MRPTAALPAFLGARAEAARVHDTVASVAQLAWRFVAWALARLGPEAPERARMAAELELELEGRPLATARESVLDAESQRLLAHGIIPEERSAALRTAVREEVLRPGAFALGLLPRQPQPGAQAA